MTSYRERFLQPEQVSSYEAEEYGAASYGSYIWQLQQPMLADLLEQQRRRRVTLRLLDFACGTGRVLSFAARFAQASDGVDISPAMLQKAAARCHRSRLLAGDITAEASLVPGPYDVITAFRFFLNAEPPVRLEVLRALRARLDPEEGMLIANVHGNSMSLRHVSLAYRRWRVRRANAAQPDLMLAEMSARQARELFQKAGFEVVEQIGFGVLPQLAHKSALRPIARWIDRRLAAQPLLRSVSVDLLFVCRPARVTAPAAASAASAVQSETAAATT